MSVALVGPAYVWTLTFDGGNMQKRAVSAVTIEDNTCLTAGLAAIVKTVATTTPGVTVIQPGAAIGAQLIDTASGALYQNLGTALTPVWTQILPPVGNANGLQALGVARFQFDPTTTAGLRTVGAHGSGITIPIHSIVVGGFVDVNTAFTSAAGTATIAIHVEAANDIITAAAVSGAPWSTIGLKAIAPKANTPESTAVKATAAREITCTVAVQDLTAGCLTGFLYYVVSQVSA